MSNPIIKDMPDPSGYDSEKDYMAACMSSEHMMGAFPDQEQRAAVCYRNWRGESVMAPPAAKHRKVFAAEVEPTKRGFTAVITTDTLDIDGEIMMPEGMDSTHFEKGGTVFWNHDYNRPVGKPVGKMRRLRNGFEADTEWAVRPAGYQGEFYPDFARAMVEQGIVKRMSIGFDPIHSRLANAADRKKWGDNVRAVYSRWRLLEYSLAPIPSNPDAVITAVRKSLLTPERAKTMFGVEIPVALKRTRKLYVAI